MAADFTIGDYSFQVANLKVKTSLLVFKKLAKTLLPAVAEVLPALATAHLASANDVSKAVQHLVENLDSLDELLEVFVPVTQASWPGRPNMTPLNGALVDAVFGGRPEMLLEYLVRCVHGEYGAFLSESGPLGAMVTRAKDFAAKASKTENAAPTEGKS